MSQFALQEIIGILSFSNFANLLELSNERTNKKIRYQFCLQLKQKINGYSNWSFLISY